MDLSYNLIKEFVRATSDQKRKTDENNHAYGYVTFIEGEPYVQLDGSEGATPVATTSNLKEGDRVLVLIEKHTATVIGNVTAPSATVIDIDDVMEEVSSVEIKAETQTFTYDHSQSVYLPETITLTPYLHGNGDLENIKWYWTTADDDSWHEIDSFEYSTSSPYLNDDMTLVIPRNASVFSTANAITIQASYEEDEEVLYSDTIGIFRVREGIDGRDGEDATLIRIDSSRGVIFKSNYFSTVLTVTIFKGPLTITNATAMRAEYGSGAYLQWYWRKFDDESWRTMLVSDTHIQNDGFTLTVTPDDVDEKIVFKCDLIV